MSVVMMLKDALYSVCDSGPYPVDGTAKHSVEATLLSKTAQCSLRACLVIPNHQEDCSIFHCAASTKVCGEMVCDVEGERWCDWHSAQGSSGFAGPHPHIHIFAQMHTSTNRYQGVSLGFGMFGW